ncbi:MAG: hypothetical protein ACLPY3_06320 [Solirubrobacteraceae bacterium]
MSSLRDAVDGYLALRRSLGYQLYGHELLLHDFADFAQRNSVDTVTIEQLPMGGMWPYRCAARRTHPQDLRSAGQDAD